MSKNLPYIENFDKLTEGDFIILECLDDVDDKAFPIQKGTTQQWEVSKKDDFGFTMFRKIKGHPKQSMVILNGLIKDDVYVSFKTFFMPYNCKFKIYIKKKPETSTLRTLFNFNK
jgi:hypothetical protein